ncbi:MAG: ABC transporter substrate-binding protein [Desulfobacteraceae bacterium]|jgi:multiple sugar transport system substrate-binding protein
MKILGIILSVYAVIGLSGFGAQFSSAEESTRLVFLTWKPNQPQAWRGLIQKFHRENPTIRVKIQVGPHSSTEYHAIVTQRLKNRDTNVDVFFMDVIWPPEFANAGWVMDLTSRFREQEQDKFLSGPIAANTYRGKIYGVPCFLGAGLFYYRKDLLQKYDLEPPRTWQKMIKHGEFILERENDPGLHVYSAQFKQYEGLVCDMLEFIWSNGGGVVNSESGYPILDDPPVLEAIAFVRDEIIGKAAPRGVINYEEPESLDLFIQGKAIFHRNWPYAWSIANNPHRSKIAGKIGVGSLPAFRGHVSASTLGGWQFGINRLSRCPEEAWRFIQFMTSHQSQRTLALKASLAPTRRSVYQDSAVLERMPHLKAFLPAFERAKPRPLSPVYPMISQELQRFFSHSIVDKESDLSKLARDTSARIERLFKLGAMINQ